MSRPSVDALPAGIVLAVTAIACWSGHATAPAIVTAAAAAVAGAILGESLARGPLRTIPALAVAAAPAVLLPLLGALCERALVLVPPPGPETVLVVVDALEVATLTFSAATGLVLLARRLPLLAPLPVAIVALVAALPLLAHRGGMIHRPRLVAELAWSRGLHPVLLLGAIGAGAAALGLLALARGRDLRGRPADVLLLVALAALLAWILPAAGLLSVPPVDPLGLAREGKEPVPGHGGTGAAPREPMPFRDEVDTSRANVPAAVVLFHDDVVPFDGIYRFRQVAFSSWNGRRLVRGVLPGLDGDLFADVPSTGVSTRPEPPGGDLRARLETTVALLARHPFPPILADGIAVSPEENPDPALFRSAFRATSSVVVRLDPSLVLAGAGDPGWSTDVRAAYLEVPPDPRYRALATEILEQMPEATRNSPLLRAVAVGRWLEEHARYSVHTRHASAPDPTASFLFGDRVGYCVHIAHAAAILCRALGVPARVAAGYASPAENRAGGSALVLLAGDAHAWCEVRIAGIGWLPIDPSPPSLDPPVPAPDLDLQRLLGELARSRGERLVHEVPAPLALPSVRAMAGTLLVLALAWVVLGWVVKAWRRVAPRLFATDPGARLAYRATLDRLGEAGLGRRHGETREAHAARLAEIVPSFAALTRIHLAAVLGRHPADRREALRLSRRVATELREAVPRRRRLRGLLAPWSWRRTR